MALTWYNLKYNLVLFFSIQILVFFIQSLIILFQFCRRVFSETTIIRLDFSGPSDLVFFHLLVPFFGHMGLFVFYINDLILHSTHLHFSLSPMWVIFSPFIFRIFVLDLYFASILFLSYPVVIYWLWLSTLVFKGHVFLYRIINAKYFSKNYTWFLSVVVFSRQVFLWCSSMLFFLSVFMHYFLVDLCWH